MSNRLEGFVKENKKQFEVKGPSDQLWDKISAELDKQQQPKKTIKLYQWASIAAVLILSLGLYFTYNFKQTSNVDVADINPVFGKKEVQFASLIEEKKDSLEIYSDKNPELYNQFTTDISKLDQEYEQLKRELQTSPNRQMIVRAMMKNLEIRSNILSQQLNIINQVNQYKKENTI